MANHNGSDCLYSKLTDCCNFIDLLDEGVALVDPESSKVLEASNRFFELFGIPNRDRDHLPLFYEFCPGDPEESKKRLQENFRVAMKEGKSRFVCGMQRKEGGLIWVDALFVRQSFSGGDHLLVFLRDVTDVKQAQKDLAEARQRYQVLFEQATDSIVVVDPETAKILEFNRAAYQNLGYTKEAFAELELEDIDIPENEEEVRDHIQRILKGEAECFQTQHMTAEGELREVNVCAKVISYDHQKVILAIWRDVTDSKRSEEELKKRVEQMEFMGRINLKRHKKMLEMARELRELREKCGLPPDDENTQIPQDLTQSE